MIIESNDNNFFKSIIQALMDFNEMNPIEPLQMVLEVSTIYILYKQKYQSDLPKYSFQSFKKKKKYLQKN